jgi:hypothetical protein
MPKSDPWNPKTAEESFDEKPVRPLTLAPILSGQIEAPVFHYSTGLQRC